mgnify:CR=1 FL=1
MKIYLVNLIINTLFWVRFKVQAHILIMKIISHAKITKGYEHWKQAFDENDSLRQEYGVTVLAYGHPKDNKD